MALTFKSTAIMNTLSRSCDKVARFLGRLVCVGVTVCGIGIASSPAYAAGTSVKVDTSPLIVQASLPPNIVLMLDDSGSMAWDYMPDWGYLKNTSSNDAVIDAANNGVYYDPTVTYSPPPKAAPDSNGNVLYYPNATGLTSAWVNGFNQSAGTVDLTKYDSSTYDTGNIIYSPSTFSTSTYSNVSQSTCQNYYYSQAGAYNYNFTGSGRKNGTCTFNYGFAYKGYFQYSTGAASGPYTVHYVAATDCQGLTSTSTPINCVLASDTSGIAAPQGVAAGQNIANWFAYYHTRILMAKSGLMGAFTGLNKNYRVGFGSIDGGGGGNSNYTNLPSSTSVPLYSYADAYNGGTNYIAQVQPFGDGTSSTDYKTSFWNWVAKAQASGGTPLRQALNAVGTYYKQDQPWKTMSTDPDPNAPELACRQSYTILTTDGFWNESFSIANVDGTSATSAITGTNGQSYTYRAALPFSDSYSNTLADVAMKYWSTDLRPNSANEVPTSTEDPAFWQHMTTFTMGLGFTPTNISPTGTTIDQIFNWSIKGSKYAITGFSWPQPASNSINNIADLAHAAVNGHGGFYSATSPTTFANGLKDALKRASERVGTGASLAANSTQLQTGTVAYQANYYTAIWKGDLKSLQINSTTGAIATSPTWTASSVLPAAASRNIYTAAYSSSGPSYMAFKNDSSGNPPALSSSQLAALASTAAGQAAMVNYLRGDATNEAAPGKPGFRARDTPIGDIVNSQPVYVGAPSPNQFANQSFSGSTSFATYASNNVSRTGLVYVAANDGLLHAFNATTGVEAYAYLPGAVITSGLSNLASQDYGSDTVPHQFFNDGELTVADVYLNSTWKTVLVGTTGRGLAKAVYALDVTDPSNIKFLWERSASDGNTSDGNSTYIGQMTGKPVIAQTSNGSWSVLMGNGYNSAAGVSALLQFDLSSGALSVHATTDTTGLAAPAVWIDPVNNGISTIAYAGDASGHVWSFALNTSSTDPNTGQVTLTATPSSAGIKLFTATDSGGIPQPITSGLLIGKDQVNNVWVFFGTGKYLATADLSDTSTQSWYGLIVKSATSSNPAIQSQAKSDRTSLVQRYITSETAASGNSLGSRTVTTNVNAASMTGLSGWYMDLLSPSTNATGSTTYIAQGERMVTPNQFQGSLLLGTTRIPKATDACNPSGTGWVMAVDPFTGTNPQTNFFDTNGDGVINSSDSINGTPAAGVGFSSLPNNPIFVGGAMLMSFDNGTTSSIQTSNSASGLQRVSWRELINQ